MLPDAPRALLQVPDSSYIKPEAPVVAGGELGMEHVVLGVDVVGR